MRRAAVSLLLAALLLPLPGFAASERQLKEAELQRLRDRIAALRQDLDSRRGRYDETRRELRTAEREISRRTVSLRQLDRQLANQRERLTSLQRQEAQQTAVVVAQRKELAQQIRAAYMLGQQDYLKLLLNQESPAALGRAVTYYDYFNRSRVERIGAVTKALADLARLRAEVATETGRLQTMRQHQSEEKKRLESQRKTRAELLSVLQLEIASGDKRLQSFLHDERELEKLLHELAGVIEEVPGAAAGHQLFAQLQGRLSWPTRGPLLVRFGEPRVSGQLRWDGVMIRASEGQSVHAVAHGRVIFADWLRGYGMLLILDHGNGFMSLYGHNQSLFKSVGDWVEAGESIASVGNSGGAERTALYFEIRHNGKPLDPSKWCKSGRK